LSGGTSIEESAAKQAVEKVAWPSHSWLCIEDKRHKSSTGKSAFATKSRFGLTLSATCKAVVNSDRLRRG
jgi:hypothetical protein